LAFENGTEGDRGGRYILSYERLVNRRIDTFLKVRKASRSSELDLKVSDLAETPDRRSQILGSSTDRATAG
jgi:hypothetical protein